MKSNPRTLQRSHSQSEEDLLYAQHYEPPPRRPDGAAADLRGTFGIDVGAIHYLVYPRAMLQLFSRHDRRAGCDQSRSLSRCRKRFEELYWNGGRGTAVKALLLNFFGVFLFCTALTVLRFSQNIQHASRLMTDTAAGGNGTNTTPVLYSPDLIAHMQEKNLTQRGLVLLLVSVIIFLCPGTYMLFVLVKFLTGDRNYHFNTLP